MDGHAVFVHYQCWNKRWDAWVPLKHTRRITSETRAEQATLDMIHETSRRRHNGAAASNSTATARASYSIIGLALSALAADSLLCVTAHLLLTDLFAEQSLPDDKLITMVRQLKDDMIRLKRERAEEERSLQQQQAETAARVNGLQRQLEEQQYKACGGGGERRVAASTRGAAVEERRLRDENTEYTKRLLKVVRVASGAVSSGR